MNAPDQTEAPSRHRQRLQPPKRYGVFLLNDDYTPMDFVVEVLQDIFSLPHDEAVAIMLQIHHSGRGLCGVYQKDIAQTKHHQVQQRAKSEGHPLRALVEEV